MHKKMILLITCCMIYATVGTDMRMKLSDSFQSPSSKFNNNNYSSLSKDNILSANLTSSDSTYSFWFEINVDGFPHPTSTTVATIKTRDDFMM